MPPPMSSTNLSLTIMKNNQVKSHKIAMKLILFHQSKKDHKNLKELGLDKKAHLNATLAIEYYSREKLAR